MLRLKSASTKTVSRVACRLVCGFVVGLNLLSGVAFAETRSAGVVALPQARAMAQAAESKAVANGTAVVVYVVDAGGRTILTERMADAQIASLELAERKAISAVFYKRPSAAFETALTGGKMAVLALPHAMPAAGGIPIFHDGRLIGAIGVSGGNNAQDEQAAEAGLAVMKE